MQIKKSIILISVTVYSSIKLQQTINLNLKHKLVTMVAAVTVYGVTAMGVKARHATSCCK
jgi:hypothetical protein